MRRPSPDGGGTSRAKSNTGRGGRRPAGPAEPAAEEAAAPPAAPEGTDEPKGDRDPPSGLPNGRADDGTPPELSSGDPLDGAGGGLVSVETPSTPEAPVPEQPAGQHCPRCGAAMTDRQEWCLSCGAAVGTQVVAAPGWRVPIAIGGLILAIAALAVAIAIVQLADDTDDVAQNQPAAAPSPAPATTPAPAITPDPALTPDPTLPEASGQETPEPTPEPTPKSGGTADAEWPAGESGWTVVLASDSSEADARDRADGFAADGISGVGVLKSDGFSSLKRGFWVVFAGSYDSQSKASDALDSIDAKDAYIRRIEPA